MIIKKKTPDYSLFNIGKKLKGLIIGESSVDAVNNLNVQLRIVNTQIITTTNSIDTLTNFNITLNAALAANNAEVPVIDIPKIIGGITKISDVYTLAEKNKITLQDAELLTIVNKNNDNRYGKQFQDMLNQIALPDFPWVRDVAYFAMNNYQSAMYWTGVAGGGGLAIAYAPAINTAVIGATPAITKVVEFTATVITKPAPQFGALVWAYTLGPKNLIGEEYGSNIVGKQFALVVTPYQQMNAIYKISNTLGYFHNCAGKINPLTNDLSKQAFINGLHNQVVWQNKFKDWEEKLRKNEKSGFGKFDDLSKEAHYNCSYGLNYTSTGKYDVCDPQGLFNNTDNNPVLSYGTFDNVLTLQSNIYNGIFVIIIAIVFLKKIGGKLVKWGEFGFNTCPVLTTKEEEDAVERTTEVKKKDAVERTTEVKKKDAVEDDLNLIQPEPVGNNVNNVNNENNEDEERLDSEIVEVCPIINDPKTYINQMGKDYVAIMKKYIPDVPDSCSVDNRRNNLNKLKDLDSSNIALQELDNTTSDQINNSTNTALQFLFDKRKLIPLTPKKGGKKKKDSKRKKDSKKKGRKTKRKFYTKKRKGNSKKQKKLKKKKNTRRK